MRYAPIEGECLGVQWSLDDTKYFTLGCDLLIVVVDHKPLVGLLNDKTLDDVANTRLFRLKEKTMPWKFTVIYRPGKGNYFGDVASRNPSSAQVDAILDGQETKIQCSSLLPIEPVNDEDAQELRNPVATSPQHLEPLYSPSPQHKINLVSSFDCEDEADMIAGIACSFSKQLPVKAVTWELVKTVTNSDPVLQQVISLVMSGFPEFKHQIPVEVQEFWAKRESLYIVDSVLLCDKSVVIPRQLRSAILETLGSAHQGVAAMKARAKDAVYWPGMYSDIEEFKKNCLTCRNIQPSQVHNTSFPPRIPSMPFESLVADYFDLSGKRYLVIADRLSGWTEVILVMVLELQAYVRHYGTSLFASVYHQTFQQMVVPNLCLKL